MSTSMQALLAALVAATAGVAVLLLAARWAQAGGEGAWRGGDALVRATIGAIAAWCVALLALGVLTPLHFFPWLSYLFLALVLAAPAVGAAALVLDRVVSARRSERWLAAPARLMAALLVVLAPLGLWMSRVEPQRLRVDRHEVVMDRHVVGSDPVRVGVITDIQTVRIGDRERRAVAMLLEQRPDIVLIAGDLFQGTANQFDVMHVAYRDLLRPLAAVPGGAFVVQGDVDSTDSIAAFIEGTGVQSLRSSEATVVVGDRTVRILGMPLEPDAAADAALEDFAASGGDGSMRIVLAHRPDWAERFGRGPAGVDLVVSGHTHGGQVQVPGFGPLITMSDIPRHMAAGGLFDHDGQQLYVSTGVGMEQQGAPQVRLGARPSVGILVLR